MKSSEFSMSAQNASQSLPKPAGWRSPLSLLLIMLLLGGGGFAWWRGLTPVDQSTATAQQPPMPVQTITLQAETIEERSEFVANLQSRRSVTLRPRTQGQITRILVTPGQRVAAGTVLIQVDPSEQQAVVNSAHASVASAQANVDNANAVLRSLQAERLSKVAEMELSQVERDRYASLATEGAVSAQTRDQYASRLEVARASLQAIDQQIQAQRASIVRAEKAVQEAQARIQEQQVQLQYFQITAPFAGVVGDIPVKVGDFVDTSTSLLTVAENDQLEVNFSVPAEQVSRLQMGSPVDVTDGQGNRLGTSQIVFIAPNAAGTTQSVLVKALLNNANGQLRTDQFVRASVVQNQRTGAQVPTTAIARLGGETFVFVAEPAETGFVARQRLVELGSIEGNEYQILSGLETGEKVIVSNLFALRDGMAIAP
ncbi:MAG: efflux RND transporter periplasmic adaptor subunit [Oscillatoriophycideae cyanobacterium NC_groundwater_1537_Pr4_S-0.65um_50_18]|nr:efflux RND transporter periplasmic adaptor subunit [Oscillatoriophycideae cyanobacterium NC_groundwater_1537_Pr4_S-0.65um_50_18]